MDKKFIGSGLIFPIIIEDNGKPNLHTGANLVNASIRHILAWPHRSRYFNENFGSRLWELIEEPNDIIVKSLVKHFIWEALVKWEKRITIQNITIDAEEPTKINVVVDYTINKTKQEETFIYPFYREIIN